MKREWRSLLAGVSVLICLLFVLFVVNQTAQVVALAGTASPAFGQMVLYGLLAVYAVILVVFVAAFVRLPRALRPPADANSPAYADYLRLLGERLAVNPLLAGGGLNLTERAGIESGLERLRLRSNEFVKSTASMVFVSTAISQSGRLDALMVLSAQARMVWRIAQVYYQRPSLGEIARLYANVAVTTFTVQELEDLDISEQMEPVVTAALSGSLAGMVPGVNLVASLVTSSILEGAANAFLTLRVGVICQRYCASLTELQPRTVRRHASVEAASMLGAIVLQSAGAVSKTIADAAMKAGVGTFDTVRGGVSRGTRNVGEKVTAGWHALFGRRHLPAAPWPEEPDTLDL